MAKAKQTQNMNWEHNTHNIIIGNMAKQTQNMNWEHGKANRKYELGT